MASTSQRLPYLDWLRVIKVFMLVPFHSTLSFVTGYYCCINSDTKNLAAQALTSILDQYHMAQLYALWLLTRPVRLPTIPLIRQKEEY